MSGPSAGRLLLDRDLAQPVCHRVRSRLRRTISFLQPAAAKTPNAGGREQTLSVEWPRPSERATEKDDEQVDATTGRNPGADHRVAAGAADACLVRGTIR